MDSLSSLQHPLVKKWKALLQDGKKRRKLESFILEGKKLVEEALQSGYRFVEVAVTTDFVRKPQNRSLVQVLRERKIPEHYVQPGLFAKLSETSTPQEILAVLQAPQEKDLKAWLRGPLELVVAAHGVQDPGNLGTLLRSGWAAQVSGILLGEGCADPWGPKCLRAGMGAQLHVPLFAGVDLQACLKTLKSRGVQAVATLPKAQENYLDLDTTRPTCFVLGSEGQGLPGDLADACDKKVRLDYPGTAESLNVAVTASILLFDYLRQRRTRPLPA